MAAFRSKEPPSLRLRSPEGTARVLRAHFARHNLRVFLLATGTLLAAVACWGILYLVCCWLMVLAFAVLDLPFPRIPPGFEALFAVTALCAIFYAWLYQRLTANDRPRDDKKLGDIAIDFALAIPKMTLAVSGTLRAWLRLSDIELLLAADLLHRLTREKRVAMSSVRLEIPDPPTAAHILFALQLTQIIDVRRDGSEYWLRLNSLRPARLRLRREDQADA